MNNDTVSKCVMKKIAGLFVLIALCALSILLPLRSHAAGLDAVRIGLIEGDVQVRTEDTADWVAASINTPLKEGDSLWAPAAGKAELQLRDGTYLRLNENSSIDVLTADKDSFQFYLASGQLYVNFRGIKDSVLQIDTPLTSIRVYDNSVFRIDAPEKGDTQISVFRGAVYAENKNESIKVDAKNALTLNDNYTKLAALGPVDSWERWNRERDDKLMGSGTSSKYVPDELKSYSSDFDSNGKWVRTPDYGYVWTPTVVVTDWAPYRVGRWVWMGGDYVWISYEPWGWAPYHYGRWVYGPSLGWFWVPPARGAVYWGPGYVGWVYTSDTVAWVPLAPGELYYGHGYYGPNSVNVTNINIINVQKTVVYKNVNVNNAVTVVNQKTFVTGKGGYVKTGKKDNPFLKDKVSFGSPKIKPERATMMPAVKDIPAAKRPPVPVRDLRVKEIKETRPLVKERTVPVFKNVKERAVPSKNSEVVHPEKATVPQIRPVEKPIKKAEVPVKNEEAKEPVKKPVEGPAKQRGSRLTPEERQKLRQQFEKNQRPAVTPVSPSAAERREPGKRPEERNKPEAGIERKPREAREPSAAQQKQIAPRKPEKQPKKQPQKEAESEGKKEDKKKD